MDPKRTAYSLKAPGRSDSGAPQRLPGRGPLPRVDDHLVVPEITRDEIVGGLRVVASPAHPPHATRLTELDYVIRAHVALGGYRVAADLLTRHDLDSDFATDVCVFKDGVDPGTGARYLEEIAFEVVSEQNERLVTEKAARMQKRGVRRVFTVWVKEGRVCEWSAESRSWRLLETDSRIEDPCLAAPLAVAALLDAAAADRSVVEALAAKDSPAILERDAVARARGVADSILMILEERDIPMSMAQRQEIVSSHDRDRLSRWLRKAVSASSAEEVTSEA
jgi:hypothetical protein